MSVEKRTNRRTFIKGAAAAAAAFVAAPRNALAHHVPATMPAPILYSEAAWRALVGDRFTISAQRGATIAATLDGVTSFPPPGPGGSAFGLRFNGPAAPVLEQGTYAMHHSVFGTFEMFLTVGSESDSGRFYSAMVNRLTP